MNNKMFRARSYGTEYVIESNDNLYDIAERFNTTVKRLKELNHLTSTSLTPGSIIIVDNQYDPENLLYYDEYIVKENDSIYTIAYSFGMTTDKLMEINNKLTDEISPGDKLYVYNVDKILNVNVYYKVQRGDNLHSIANRFHVTVDDLKKWNSLTTEKLQVGDELLVLPKEMIKRIRDNAEIYFVLPGDNLYSLAKSRGVSVDRLKAINNLTSDELYVGQSILLPYNG